MYISSVPDFINTLIVYSNNPDTYIGMLKKSNHTHSFAFNKDIKDILKNYSNYYILVRHIDEYHELYDYAHIDISYSLLINIHYKSILISNEDYMLYKLTHI